MKRAGQMRFIPAWHRKPIDKSPLLIVLHGRGDTMEPFYEFHKELGIPELNLLLINGHRTLGTGYSWCALEPHHIKGILKTRNILSNTIEVLVEMGWRRENIFLFGFSEGGLVAADFVMHSGQKIGGYIGVSSCVNFLKNWRQQMRSTATRIPILMTHGFNDDVLWLDDTKGQVQKLRSAGMKIEWKEFVKEHEIDTKEELPVIANWLKKKFKSKARASGRIRTQ